MVSRTVRNFGKVRDAVEIPGLVAIQKKSYEDFLQKDVAANKRKDIGLESLFREIFPVESYDKNSCLEYVCYELEEPRYPLKRCRQLRLTYGYPLKICCRLREKKGEDVSEQWVYLGEMPVMIGGGEFIINGAERVIVSQLHRSPGVDFLIESKEGDRVLHGGRIIPERGSWIEIGVTKKDVLTVKIDQSSRIPATVFLRAIDASHGDTESIIRLFYPTKTVSKNKLTPDMWSVGPIVDTETGEVIVSSGEQIGDRVSLIQQSRIKNVEVVEQVRDPLILNTLAEDDCQSNEHALLRFYMRLRPGNPPNQEKAKTFFREKFFDTNRYRLGKVGRFRLNRKFGLSVRDNESLKNEIRRARDELRENLKDNFEKWLKSEEGRKWVEVNQDVLRKKYLVKGGERTGGFAFKYVVTEIDGNPLKDKKPKCELTALETKLSWEYPVDSQNKLPRFNKKEEMSRKEVEGLFKKNPQLEDLFKLCKQCIESESGWITINRLDMKLEKDKVPNKQGIYFFKSLKTKRVKDGYVGKAGANKSEKPRSQGLSGRLEEHFGARFKADTHKEIYDCGDNLLNTWALDEKKESAQKEIKLLEEELARLESPDYDMTLCAEDFINTMRYIVGLRNNEGEVDDIDHLGNRRLRTIDELASDEVRKGLLKLRKTVQERLSTRRDTEEPVRIADLVNSKSVSSSINYFFGRGELSQIVDQTNALSQLTHERRLSALGPGGLNRRRAGFEVRDVHISHYGRICPIETPEGTNIGLISSLAIFATIDEYGFLLTPYRRVKDGVATGDVDYLRADEDMKAIIAAPAAFDQETGKIQKDMVLAMKGGELAHVAGNDVNYVDVSPKQTVGISASLIPFLEHDDANRALMGSNMQRQAVPLLKTERPLVGTGMEEVVGQNSSMVVRAEKSGTVTAVDSLHIVIDGSEEYTLSKFVDLNERTCLNQVPTVKLGEKAEKGQVIADGGGIANSILALGKNLLVGFVSFDGFNFEDAIIISEKLVKNDSFTSIHIDEFTAEVRETRLGREEFTNDIPNVSEKALRNLDESGIIREGTRVCTGDILVGKVVPKSKTELTPEEKLLHAIFGRAGEDVKNDSLELPSGYEGVVIRTEKFMRRGAGGEEQKKAVMAKIKEYRQQMKAKECAVFRQMVEAIHKRYDVSIVDPSTRQKAGSSEDDEVVYEQVENFNIKWVRPAGMRDDVEKIVNKFWMKITELQEKEQRHIDSLKHGDELPSGVVQMVKVYVATKRTLSIGDKIAGRHGNKGVIAKIMPEEDMPFLEDGTSLDILLNPLGVPSRMNVGQILETHLGWVAKVLGFNAITPVFDGATEKDIQELTKEANEVMRQRVVELEEKRESPLSNELFVNVPGTLKTQLYDGRTGEPFDQQATIGYIYMMKLHHLVDDKIHARATGPYSLITQQPLGGKARTGGQRFGEMEVWALEGYGAAYTLQEMLTVKSDDVEGRTKIYESMVKGTNTLEAGTPLSFDVLCNEIRGLGMNIQLEKKRLGSSVI